MEASQNKYENWISNHKFTSWMNSFVNSKFFLIIISMIIIISDCFAQEVICFSLIAIFSIIALVVSKDTKPLIFILLTFQMGMSFKNGISYNENPELPNIYDNKNIILYFSILGTLVILTILYNFFIFQQYKNKFNHIVYLLPGLIALSISYLLGGCIGNFSLNNLVYSASNCFMILAMYFYFSLTAFNNLKSDKYISNIMLYTTFIISIEMIHIYCTVPNIIYNGHIYKGAIKNGWGIHNNFAGYFNVSFPFIAYISFKNKNKLLPIIGIITNITFTILTLSRNGYVILFLEILTAIVLLFIFKKDKRKILLISFVTITLILLIFMFIFSDSIFEFFYHIFDKGLDLSGREELYKTAFEAFLNNPIFGKGWFLFDKEGYIPPTQFAPSFKAHNFILQLLGSTGIIGIIGFVILLSYIGYYSIKKRTSKKILFLLAILVLLSTSFLDNFFFDYGFERYFAIFLVGIAIELKKEKEYKEVIETKEAPVNE